MRWSSSSSLSEIPVTSLDSRNFYIAKLGRVILASRFCTGLFLRASTDTSFSSILSSSSSVNSWDLSVSKITCVSAKKYQHCNGYNPSNPLLYCFLSPLSVKTLSGRWPVCRVFSLFVPPFSFCICKPAVFHNPRLDQRETGFSIM